MFRLTTSVVRMNTPQQVSDTLSRVVKAAMKTSGHSQRDVAEATGIPLVTLNRRLTGSYSFTVLEVAAIAEVIGVGVTDLFLRAERSTIAA